MKQFSLFLFVFLFARAGFSQHQVAWAKQWGTYGFEQNGNVAIDAQGNVYVCGWFTYRTDFDPGPDEVSFAPAGGNDAYICKFTPQGDLVWAKALAATGNQDTRNVKISPGGDLYVSGMFENTVDFDAGPANVSLSSPGPASTYIARYKTDGSLVWVRQMQVSTLTFVFDTDDNLYLAGRFHATQDFDPGPGVNNMTSVGWIDNFISKWESDANLLWVQQIPHVRNYREPSIGIDARRNLYISSVFDTTIDFNPGPGVDTLTAVNLLNDIFIAKYDSVGNFAWVRQIRGSTDFDMVLDMVVDSAGNSYSAGIVVGIADMDPGPGTHYFSVGGNGGDTYILKLDSDGNYVWAERYSSFEAEGIQSLALGSDHTLYTAGFFGGTVDFDPGPGNQFMTADLGAGTFIVALDTSGSYLWANHLDNIPWEFYYTSIAVDADANLYVNGAFADSANFNPQGSGLPAHADSLGYNDIFLVKLSPCVLPTDSIQVLGCGGSYTWPLNGRTYHQTGIYYQSLAGSGGCDSTVVMDLEVPVIYNEVAETDGVLHTNPNVLFDSYQWISCGTQATVGTEQAYTPETAGSYAVIVGMDGCLDTSDCLFLPLDIPEAETAGIRLYPNPTADLVYLELKNAPGAAVEVLDVTGKSLYRAQYVGNGAGIPTQGLKPGPYLIRIQTGTNTYTYRIIKQ